METTAKENVPEVKRTPEEWKARWRQQAIEKYPKIDPWEQHLIEKEKIEAPRRERKARLLSELQQRIDSEYKNKYPVRYWIKQFIKKYFIF